jgi:hypothetical protein
VVHPTVMMRRTAVDKIGGYRAEYELLEDLDLFLRLSDVGEVANLAAVLLQHRNVPTSLQKSRASRQRAVRRRIVEEAFARRGESMPRRWPIYERPRSQALLMDARLAQERGELWKSAWLQWQSWLWNPFSKSPLRELRRTVRAALRRRRGEREDERRSARMPVSLSDQNG